MFIYRDHPPAGLVVLKPGEGDVFDREPQSLVRGEAERMGDGGPSVLPQTTTTHRAIEVVLRGLEIAIPAGPYAGALIAV